MGATDRFLKRGRIQDFSRGPIAKMLSELKKFGANGHLYIPGPGVPTLGPERTIFAHASWASNGDGSYTKPSAIWGGVGGNETASVGKTYQISFRVVSITAGTTLGVYRRDATNTSNELVATFNVAAGGRYTAVAQVLIDQATYDIWVDNNTFVGTIDSVVMREVLGYTNTINGITAGNYLDSTGTTNASVDGNVGLVKDPLGSLNATQSTTGYQPKLRRGLVNYQLNSVPIGGQWVAEATGTGVVPTVTYNYATAPDGSPAARAILDKGAGATSADLSQFRAGNSTVLSGAPYTSAIWLRTTVEGTTGAVSLRDNIAASTLTVKDQWQLFVRSGNAISNIMSVGVRLRPTEATNSQADILVGAAGIFQGTLTAAQILAAGGIPITTSAPASSSSGAYKWELSTDDYLAQASAPFGFADNHYIAAAGVCNASSGVISTLASVGGSAAGHISLDVLNGLVRANWTGSAQVLSTLAAPDGIPFTASLTKIGNTGKVSKNGAKAAGVDLTSVVSVTTTAATVGARCLSTLSSFHNGGIYGAIEVKGTVSDAQDLIFQRGLNALAQYAAGRF